MSVTTYYSGRWGNCIFSAGMLLAYAKKHNLKFWMPEQAVAYNHFRNGDLTVPFFIPSTGKKPINPIRYQEPNMADGTPHYHDIPKMDNVLFDGYWQSFSWMDEYRDYILEVFNFPYKMDKGVTSISVRRGDCVNSPNFPIAPKVYYQKAVNYILERGFNKFKVFSDDIEWCKLNFNNKNFPSSCIFEFCEGLSEVDSFLGLCNCENNITARSTFSLTSAWCNKNHNKIVLVPTDKFKWWKSQNADLIPSYFHKIDFDKHIDEWSK